MPPSYSGTHRHLRITGKKTVKLAIIVATANNRVIGADNALPWRLPEDLKYFRSVTLGKPLIMGRKTYESIGRPLPGRTNIVVSSRPDWRLEGAYVVGSLEQAIACAGNHLDSSGEVMIIGGEQLYLRSLPVVDRIYLTKIKLTVEGDAFFPPYNESDWNAHKVKSGFGADGLAYEFLILDRR